MFGMKNEMGRVRVELKTNNIVPNKKQIIWTRCLLLALLPLHNIKLPMGTRLTSIQPIKLVTVVEQYNT